MKLPHALGHLYAIVLPSAGTTAVCSLKSNSAVRLHETASCYRKSSRLYAYIRPYEYAFAQNLFNPTAQATSCSAVCMLRDAGHAAACWVQRWQQPYGTFGCLHDSRVGIIWRIRVVQSVISVPGMSTRRGMWPADVTVAMLVLLGDRLPLT